MPSPIQNMGSSVMLKNREMFLLPILLGSIAFFPQLGCGEIIDFDIPEIVDYGICPLPKTGVVDMERFSGVWYQVEEVPNQYVAVKQCIRTKYIYNGTSLLVTTEGLDKLGKLGEKNAVLSTVEPRRASVPPYLQLTAQNVPNVPYHVLKVNYTGYACVYSCFEVIELKVEVYSILSRTPYPSEESLEVCRRAFQGMRLNLKKLRRVKQGEKCWYAKDLVRHRGPGDIVFPARVAGFKTNGKVNLTRPNLGAKPSNPDLDVALEESGGELISVLKEAGEEDEVQGYKNILVGNDTLVQLNIKKISPGNGGNGQDKKTDDTSECSDHCKDTTSSSAQVRLPLESFTSAIVTVSLISLYRAT